MRGIWVSQLIAKDARGASPNLRSTRGSRIGDRITLKWLRSYTRGLCQRLLKRGDDVIRDGAVPDRRRDTDALVQLRRDGERELTPRGWLALGRTPWAALRGLRIAC